MTEAGKGGWGCCYCIIMPPSLMARDLSFLKKIVFWEIFYLDFSKGKLKPTIYLLSFFSLKNPSLFVMVDSQ